MVIIPDRTIKEESSDDCNELNFAHLNEVKEIKQDCRTDLTDFTFLMPLRIDSEKRRENADTSISFILRHFDTTVIVVEGDRSKKYYPDLQTENFLYDFIDDKNVFFHNNSSLNFKRP